LDISVKKPLMRQKMILGRYGEAIPLLETIFNVREKLLTIANVHVVLVLCELVSPNLSPVKNILFM
jgi:short subunit fatty acids transporter